mgnify:CR=1 FL=1
MRGRSVRIKGKRFGLIIVLAWLLIALASPLLMPAWSQTTYTVTYNPVDDALADYHHPDTNYGSDTILTISGNINEGIYLKFNLSDFTLPVERIVSAKLRIYNPTTTAAYKIEACGVADDSWEEETLTYNNKPGESSSCSDPVSAQANSWMELDITGFFSNFISSSDKLLSIAVVLNTASASVSMATKEYAESQYWPQLVIEYTPYTETQTQTITETVTITETATETATAGTTTVTETLTTTATETQTETVNTTVTDYVTETQTLTTTVTDTVYATETAYTTETATTTQTITDVITETATTTLTETSTVWANETVTVTTTITPITTITEYGNATLVEQSVDYQALADMLMPIVLIVGVLGTLLSLLLQSTSFRRGD